MQTAVFTQLTPNELGQLIDERLENFLTKLQNTNKPKPDRIGGMGLAVEITGLKPSTIYSKVHNLEIPFSKPQGTKQLIFRESELLDWIAKGRKKTRAETAKDAASHPAASAY
jgi:predicted DNA-binding transcriptional regulator AlpA